MKEKKKSFTAFLLSLLMVVCCGLLGTGVKAEATADTRPAPDLVKVTLHKKKFTAEPNQKKNTGLEMKDFGGDPVPGIEFKVYDVTKDYLDMLNDGKTPEEAAQVLQEDPGERYTKLENVPGTNDGNYLGAQTTGNGQNGTAGDAVFNLPAKNADGEDAVYLFVETPHKGISSAANLVLALPVQKGSLDREGNFVSTGEVNKDIHLYPKNVIPESSIKLIKTGTDCAYDADSNLLSIAGAEFIIKDSDGNFFKGDTDPSTNYMEFNGTQEEAEAHPITTIDKDALTISGLFDGDYTLIETKAPTGYAITSKSKSISFKIANGKLASGENGAVLAEDDFQDNGLPENGANFRVDCSKLSNTIVVQNRAIGRFQFQKVDAKTGKPIKGAEFEVAKYGSDNPEGKTQAYLYTKNTPSSKKDGSYDYIWSDQLTQENQGDYHKVTFTTTDNAPSELNNLKLGTFYLKETKAPDGYLMPKGADVYTPIEATKEGQDITVLSIKNTPKSWLPSTGGMGTIIFLAAGLAVAGCALIILKKMKERAEI